MAIQMARAGAEGAALGESVCHCHAS